MSLSSSQPSWKTARGDEWWWTGTPTLVGSLYESISVFAIDNPFAGTPHQFRAVLQVTAEQFPELQIHCIYDDQMKNTLDQLQQTGLLRWADVGNPYSQYAAIELVTDRDPRTADDDEDAPPEHAPARSRRALTALGAFVVGLLFLIRGALVLLRGVYDSYGYSRPDDLFFGVVGFPVGFICLAVALHLRRTRPPRAPDKRKGRELSSSHP